MSSPPAQVPSAKRIVLSRARRSGVIAKMRGEGGGRDMDGEIDVETVAAKGRGASRGWARADGAPSRGAPATKLVMASREKNRELMLGQVIPERIKRQNRLRQALKGLKKEYDLIILDCLRQSVNWRKISSLLLT